MQNDVRRSLSGDTKAFGRLMDEYAAPVRGYLQRMVGDYHASQDLAQETFLKAYTSLRNLDSPPAFGSWLFRIAFHVAVDFQRSRDLGTQSLEAHGAAVPDPDFDETPPIERDEERRLQYDAVVRAVASMPERYGLVVVLRYLEQQTYFEMAQLLNLSLANVKVRLHRARKMIRHKVAGDAASEPEGPMNNGGIES